MKHFDITFFYGPTPEYIVKEECIADMAASGITLCQLYWHDTNIIKQALPLLAKYGLRANVCDPRILELYKQEKFEEVDRVVKEVVEDYTQYSNVAEWGVCDEPEATKFPILAALVKAFRKYSDKTTDINLFPDYAVPEQLKAPDYQTYLEDFVKTVKPHFLSYDYYQFMGRPPYERCHDGDEDLRELLIRRAAEGVEDRDGFFNNLAVIRELGIKNGLEQMLIVQLVEHADCRNLTYEEILWEVNMCLVYGMHRISYFTYWLPEDGNLYFSWNNSMCDTKGNKFQHYYDVQAINKEIHPIGEMLFETKSTDVFHIGELQKGTVAFEGYGPIEKIEGDNAVIGFFENGYVYLVNRDFKNANTFTICANKTMSIYRDGKFETCESTHTVTLGAGAGILLK